MATYVFSDVHGHIRPLERVLERVSPGAGDSIWCLGDMVDRGPDPVGVMRLVKDVCGECALLGNHEDMLLAHFADPDDPIAMASWALNGARSTRAGIAELDEIEALELIRWVQDRPRAAFITVGEQDFLLVHAGIMPGASPRPEHFDEASVAEFIAAQSPEDLVWIREEFWEKPTGLVDENGEGPIVIAGHTPTLYLDGLNVSLDRGPRGDDGLCRMVRVGACAATGGVADKWDIDCGAAGGCGFGQIMVLRLDDGEEFLEPIGKDE